MAAGPLRVGIALRNRSARALGNRRIAPQSWAERTEGGDDLRRVHALPALRIPGAGTTASCQVTRCVPAAGPTPRTAPLGAPRGSRATPFFQSPCSSVFRLDTRLAYLSAGRVARLPSVRGSIVPFTRPPRSAGGCLSATMSWLAEGHRREHVMSWIDRRGLHRWSRDSTGVASAHAFFGPVSRHE